MSDLTGRSGNEPAMGGAGGRTGNEPALGGAEIKQLREALDRVSQRRQNPLDDSTEIDPQKLLKEGIVLLTSDINDETATRVIAQLLYLDRWRRGENIVLIISSSGGEVYSAFAIIDAMTNHLHSP